MAPPVKSIAQYEAEATRHPDGCLVHPSCKARTIYQLRHGPIKSSEVAVCHTCDNPKCIEDSHHFLGTWKDNIRDAVRKGRHSAFSNIQKAQAGLESLRNSNTEFHTPEGKRSLAEAARARFTGVPASERTVPLDKIIGVKFMLCAGMQQHEIQETLGVSQSLVSRTKRGKYDTRLERLW
jgi:hypothetical protein